MNTRVIVLLVLFVAPALWTVAHGQADDKGPRVPTAEKELRQNEKVGLKTDDEVVEREEEKINPDGFSIKELKMLQEKADKYHFQAEVNKLMNIIINSLYSNREVFLRELISNASDALDKIRFLSLMDQSQLGTKTKLEIKIKASPDGKTLHIIDSGIGMTKDELRDNLGTIAKSGTTEFLEKLGKSGDTNLIGQFGVGFYSAFLVADQVTVISKHNSDKQYIWQSDSQGEYSIAEDPRGNTLGRGTEIILHLKEDAAEYLDNSTIEPLINKYSEFINFPISIWHAFEEEKEVPLTEEEIAQKKKEEQEKKDEEGEEIKLEGEEKETETTPEKLTKTVKETRYDWKLVSQTKPIWTRNSKDLTDEDYNNFYKSFSKDTEDPLTHIHFNAEGEVDFKSILFIPQTPPPNLYDPSNTPHKGLKLYVKRVFITDEFKDLLPKYLAFIKGVVDSDDLPLNVSREMLQEHKTLKVIKKKLVRKAIAMLQVLAEKEDKSQYNQFWKNYGTNVKLGIIEDAPNRTRLSKLLMFLSSKTGDYTTLDKYVERMKKGQEQIYYLAGESKEAVQSSPLLERLVKKGFEVLYMIDPIDEYALANMEKYDGKYKLTNIARDGLKLDGESEDKEKEKEIEEQFSSLTKFLKSTLGDKIEKVVISKRLAKSPSALVASSYGWTANMERIVKAQALADPSRHSFYAPKKVMEINVKHPIVVELNRRVGLSEQDETAKDIAKLMYETAALTSGFTLDDQAEFAKRIVRMMNLGLNLDADAAPEEEPEPEPEPQEEVPQPVQTEEKKDDKDEL